MASSNITISVEEDTKRRFSAFCENVGMNVTTAFNLYMKAVLRTRQLPFAVTDIDTLSQPRGAVLARGKAALREAQAQAALGGSVDMTLDDINDEIAAYRQERREI